MNQPLPPLIPFDQMPYHPTSETLVEILKDRAQRENSLFFRLSVAYYFSLAAGHMRCYIKTPDRGDVPVNAYVMNLAPSSYGKTMTSNFLKDDLLGLFRSTFMEQTFPLLADQHLDMLANRRASRKATDPVDERKGLDREFGGAGPMAFTFNSGTAPAVKQLRHKILLANAGSLNLVMDEVGDNLTPNKEVFDAFLELYDKGLTDQKLLKHGTDNPRNEEITGKTAVNLLMFGVPDTVFDGDVSEKAFMAMLRSGYARRCFFGYVPQIGRKANQTAEQIFDDRTNQTHNATVAALAEHFERLADMINVNKPLMISRETCIKLYQYQLLCEERADKFRKNQEFLKREMCERNFKVLKLAGAYAFVDDVPEVTDQHIYNAIRLAEDSGEAFAQMLTQDRAFMKLAKYIADVGETNTITQADLVEDLPFYRGSASVKQEMMSHAIGWGYKNNVIIKRYFENNIEFFRGECLKSTNLNQMILSYSDELATDYQNHRAPFSKLHQLTQTAGKHWVAHHVVNGHRSEEDCIPGFNMVVIDVDGTASMAAVQALMKNYQYLLYTTKSHTAQENCFRIILPTNYELKLDAKDYKEFMAAIFEWLPFEVDEQTGQRSRKWLSHNGSYVYNEGALLDVLPFIPKTSKNEERKQLVNSQQSLDNLERWVINNIGDGNRNNMLLRYAKILVDAGFDFDGICSKVISLNDKTADKLDEAELMSTIMKTVAKDLAKRP